VGITATATATATAGQFQAETNEIDGRVHFSKDFFHLGRSSARTVNSFTLLDYRPVSKIKCGSRIASTS
jgi:hypothetical protein